MHSCVHACTLDVCTVARTVMRVCSTSHAAIGAEARAEVEACVGGRPMWVRRPRPCPHVPDIWHVREQGGEKDQSQAGR